MKKRQGKFGNLQQVFYLRSHLCFFSIAAGGQQSGAGGSLQRAGKHGAGAATGRCGGAFSAPKHPRC